MTSRAARTYAIREGIEFLLILVGLAVASRFIRFPVWLWVAILGGKVLFSLVAYLLLLRSAFRRRALLGPDALVGTEAVALSTLRPQGQILVRGEIWRAQGPTNVRIERNERVRIVAIDGRVLHVEPVESGGD